MIKVRCKDFKGCTKHECPHWDIHGYSKVECKKHLCKIIGRKTNCVDIRIIK